tara:strand:- start:1590 stop:1883 length:294 start_codon:yes stop_codon:yes gene_type:complete
MNNLIEILKLKINFRKKILILLIAFIFGLIVPAIPSFIKVINIVREKRAIESNKKNYILKLKYNCKKNNKYEKLLDLGFQRFALEEFDECMKDIDKN